MSNVRVRGKIRREEWPKITERFNNGETLTEIARSYQCTAPAIRYIVGRASALADEEKTERGTAESAASLAPGEGKTERATPESAAAPAPGESRRGPAQVVAVEGRAHAGKRSTRSATGEVWERISSEITSFLAAMDALSANDSDDNYEALLLATDHLLWASARTRVELERVLASRKTGHRKKGVP